MRNVARYIGVEWKLMFRGFGVWVILIGLLAIFYSVSNDVYYDFNLGFKAMHTLMVLLPLFIAIFFLAMFVARREITTKTQLLFLSLSFKTSEIVASKLLALAIPFALIQLMPALQYLVLASRIGLSFAELKAGFFILLASIIPGWFLIVVGYLIGSLSRKRTVYLLGIIIFFCLTYGVNLYVTRLAPYLDIMDFTQLDFFTPMQSTVVYSKIWGFTADINYWVHRVFYMSIVIGLLMGYIHWKAWKRKEHRNHYKYYIGLSIISVILLWSFIAFTSVWQDRFHAFHKELAFYKAAKPQAVNKAFEHIEASDYQIDVTINTKHQLEVTAQFLVTNHSGANQERFPLTLRHSFQVQEVLINNQKAAAASGDHEDVVWITPNQVVKDREAIKVKLIYNGNVDEWRNVPQYEGNLLTRYVFVDQDRMNLLGIYGWYPIGGIHQLTVFGSDYGNQYYLMDHTFEAPSADFKVTVHTSKRLNLYSNGTLASEKHEENKHEAVFTAKQANGFSLVGGALQSVEYKVGDKTMRLLAGKQMQTKQLQSNLTVLVETAQQMHNVLVKIWGSKIKQELAENETFMITEENNPFAAIGNQNNPYVRGIIQDWQSFFVDTNGIKLLPLGITRDFTQKEAIVRWMLPYYMEGELKLNKETEGIFYSLLTAYLTKESEVEKKELFISQSTQFDPRSLYGLINKIYLASSEEQFLSFIRDLYTELTKAEGNYEQTMQQIHAFVKNRAAAVDPSNDQSVNEGQ
jgi:hypothetical protein